MEAPNILLANSILGCAFIFLLTCIRLLYVRVDKDKDLRHKEIKEIIGHIDVGFEKVSKQFETFKKDLDLLDDRVDLFDRLLSPISDSKFNSKLVAQGLRNEPSMDDLKQVIRSHKIKATNGSL